MAYATMIVSNGVEVKKVPLGYSWTILFFSGFPALLRQDWVSGICLLLCEFALGGWGGLMVIPMSFVYNKRYAQELLKKGYKVTALPPGYDLDHVKTYTGLAEIPTEFAVAA